MRKSARGPRAHSYIGLLDGVRDLQHVPGPPPRTNQSVDSVEITRAHIIVAMQGIHGQAVHDPFAVKTFYPFLPACTSFLFHHQRRAFPRAGRDSPAPSFSPFDQTSSRVPTVHRRPLLVLFLVAVRTGVAHHRTRTSRGCRRL